MALVIRNFCGILDMACRRRSRKCLSDITAPPPKAIGVDPAMPPKAFIRAGQLGSLQPANVNRPPRKPAGCSGGSATARSSWFRNTSSEEVSGPHQNNLKKTNLVTRKATSEIPRQVSTEGRTALIGAWTGPAHSTNKNRASSADRLKPSNSNRLRKVTKQ